MKQTAVEWLYDQLEFDDSISMDDIEKIFDQAKQMENEQKEELIKKACSLVFLAIGDGGDITTNEVIEILKKDGSY